MSSEFLSRLKLPKREGKFWVYVLRCVDGTYYTGCTNDFPERLRLHKSGNGAKYLRGRGPITLVYAKEYRYYKNAIRAKQYLKRQTRQYKEELIRAHGIEQG